MTRVVAVARLVGRLPALVLVALVRAYQLTVSPMLGPVCRFYPSCSHYGVEALRTHGALRGTALTAWRIARCNPWNPGGVDLVPPARGAGTTEPAGTTDPAGTLTTDHPAGPAADHSAGPAATHDGAPGHPARAA